MASYNIVFKDERKNIIVYDIRTFILLGDKTVLIHEDDTESSFLNVFSISMINDNGL